MHISFHNNDLWGVISRRPFQPPVIPRQRMDLCTWNWQCRCQRIHKSFRPAENEDIRMTLA